MEKPYSQNSSETVRGARIPNILSGLQWKHSRYSASSGVVILSKLDYTLAFQYIPFDLALFLHCSEERQEETKRQERLVKGCFYSKRDKQFSVQDFCQNL